MISHSISKEYLIKFDLIKNNYPNTFEWIKDKARWEHITLLAVLNEYEPYINELIKKEVDNK